tara:strand:- start:816 stop:1334 length:519 start_codon:yes stop_codon:yes gene_type:complete
MPDYQQAKIYKLINYELKGLVYYGSTTQTLNERFSSHKSDSKTKNKSSKIMFSLGSPEIILLEYYPCSSKEELEARERVWVEGNECVNHNIPGRTGKEYHEDNKEKILEYKKQWREDNKETLTEKFDCQCGGKYTQANKSGHLKTKKHKEFISSTQPVVDVDHVNQQTLLLN